MQVLESCKQPLNLPFVLHLSKLQRKAPCTLNQEHILDETEVWVLFQHGDYTTNCADFSSSSHGNVQVHGLATIEKSKDRRGYGKRLVVRGCQAGEKKSGRRSFLSLEEAGLIEISGLSTHERFLCRLTISSLNLLRVISEQEGCAIEELNAGRICDWFVKDKLKREQNPDSAVLQWDESEFQL